MRTRILTLASVIAILGTTDYANASGFALIEQSVSGMGNAYAGGAAHYYDASSIYFNPAGMTNACGCQMVAGGHVIFPIADWDDQGSILWPVVTNSPVALPAFDPYLTGNDGRDGGENALVGHFAYVKPINDCWTAGLTINSPFGLVTDYNDNWKGRYHAIRSQLLTINVNPCVAYKVNNCLSIGVGVSAQYLHAKLSSAVDYGSIAWAGSLATPFPEITQSVLNDLNFNPQTQDGRAKLKGNSWGWGANIGIVWEPRCGTSLGLHYRSEVKHKVKGEEKFEDLPEYIANPSVLSDGPLSAFVPFFQSIKDKTATNTRARAETTLPSTVSLSAYHEFNRCWAIMGDATWTKWDVLKRLVFKFSNENQAPSVTTLNWENSWRFALGVTFKPNDCWTLRTGVAYDQTPVPNAEDRTPRIPDEDRTWATIGCGYQFNNCLHLDFGYAHLFVREPKIDKTSFELPEDHFRGGLKGKYDAYTDIVSAQIVWDF